MPDPVTECIRSAHDALATARRLLHDEISTYPTPIAGCDAQFNHLLSERQKVIAALSALEDAVFVPTPRRPTPSAGVESR